MRALNIFAALSAVCAIGMLVIGAHALTLTPEDADRLHQGAYLQLFAGVAGIAIANRSGKLNLIAGAMILAGAALFAGVLYVIATTQSRALVMLAPVGGITLIAGFALLAFAKPRT